MTPEVEGVLETAKSLERRQIAELAYELLRVLDDDAPNGGQAKNDAAWRAAFRARIDGVESGEVQLVSHDETLAAARALLAARAE